MLKMLYRRQNHFQFRGVQLHKLAFLFTSNALKKVLIQRLYLRILLHDILLFRKNFFDFLISNRIQSMNLTLQNGVSVSTEQNLKKDFLDYLFALVNHRIHTFPSDQIITTF